MPLKKSTLQLSASIFTAVLIIAVAWFTQGTPYDDAWLYVIVAWAVFLAISELSCRNCKVKPPAEKAEKTDKPDTAN